MKDPILEILLDNLGEVIRGDMFDPQDNILGIKHIPPQYFREVV